MAYVKILPVHTAKHLQRLLEYTAQPDKTQSGKLVHYAGCQPESAYTDFMRVQQQNGFPGSILAHQIIQSFPLGEVTPGLAHQIGIELAEQALPGYQYTVCTHVDAKQVNTHITFNAVSAATGKKYHSQKETLALLRDRSDALCREHGLSVITKKSGYRGLDKDTYELAQKGKSWKAALAADLDELLYTPSVKPPRNMRQLIRQLGKKGYTVRLTEKSMTVTRNGEKKGIRVDTLARQFGVQYRLENIKRVLHGEPPDLTPPPVREPVLDPNKSEKVRAEKMLFPGFAETDKGWMALRQKNALLHSRSPLRFLLRAAALGLTLLDKETAVQYRRVMHGEVFGNVPWRTLREMYGETVSLPCSKEEARALHELPIPFSGRELKDGQVYVSFKTQHRQLIGGYLGRSMADMKTQSEKQAERDSRDWLNAVRRTRPEERCISFSCTKEELEVMQQGSVPFRYYLSRDGLTVGFLAKDLPEVCTALGWCYQQRLEDVLLRYNRGAYRKIKQACNADGVRPAYRVVDPALLPLLEQQNILFAAFEAKQAGKYNLAMHPDQLAAFQSVCAHRQELHREVKRHLEETGQQNEHGKKPRHTL